MELELGFTRTHLDDSLGQHPFSIHKVADVIPPAGVPSTMIQIIRIRLQISPQPNLKRKRNENSNFHDHNFLDKNDIEIHSLEAIKPKTWTGDVGMAAEGNDLSKGDAVKTSAKLMKQTARLSFKDIVKIVDRSLRGVISTPKRARTDGQLLSNMVSSLRLGQLSPMIFSPTYREVDLHLYEPESS